MQGRLPIRGTAKQLSRQWTAFSQLCLPSLPRSTPRKYTAKELWQYQDKLGASCLSCNLPPVSSNYLGLDTNYSTDLT